MPFLKKSLLPLPTDDESHGFHHMASREVPQDAEDRVVEMVRLPYGYRIEERNEKAKDPIKFPIEKRYHTTLQVMH